MVSNDGRKGAYPTTPFSYYIYSSQEEAKCMKDGTDSVRDTIDSAPEHLYSSDNGIDSVVAASLKTNSYSILWLSRSKA